jgi:hypothetical protein
LFNMFKNDGERFRVRRFISNVARRPFEDSSTAVSCEAKPPRRKWLRGAWLVHLAMKPVADFCVAAVSPIAVASAIDISLELGMNRIPEASII